MRPCAARPEAGGGRLREVRRGRPRALPGEARRARAPDRASPAAARRRRSRSRTTRTVSRTMQVDAIGEPWRTEDVPSALLAESSGCRSRRCYAATSTPTCSRGSRAAAGPARRAGLVRRRATGPLVLDADFDPAVLRHVSVLKLAEEEAAAIGDLARARRAGDRRHAGAEARACSRATGDVHVPARSVAADPTGAGDAFGVGYLGARAEGHSPLSAARRATALVAALLAGGGDDRRGRDRRRRRARRRRGGDAARPRRGVPEVGAPNVELPRVVAAARNGATIVAVVDRRPPLAISRDGGATWTRVRRRPAARLRDRDRRRRSRPDALRRAQPALPLGERRRLLARAPVRAAGHRSPSAGSTTDALSEAELAARDDDRRAADLDALDSVRRAVDARVQLRRPADLGALLDLDLVAERDPPVAREVERERPAAEPVAGPRPAEPRPDIRALPATCPPPAKQLIPSVPSAASRC